jgi:two-component system, OmpR family, phosphate regulon sensor histidine kinase PhoR
MINAETPEILERPMILVIDDEERIREGCRKVLCQEGFDVATADCGELGLKMIEQQHFDIVLLDLMMPSLSGFDVLAQVKALHPDSVIIVISGYATVEHSIEAMKRGAFDFIPKPFAPEQLRILVAKAIEYTRALQDIANEKSRMRVLINHLRDGVMAVDMEKRVVLANPAFLRMLGYQGTSAIGRNADEVCHNTDVELLMDRALSMPPDELTELAEDLTEGNGGASCASVLNARCVPFRDRRGRNVGAITVLHDITALKRMEQIKSDFVSMVSHEVRGPLNAVLAQLNVVTDGLTGEVSQKQKEVLGRASEKISAVLSLSTELLDLARIESGLISQEKEQLNLAEIIEDQVEFHRAAAQAKLISLDLEPLPPLPPIVVNRRNMEEVLSNLIGNAIKYTPEGGKVVVSAGMENGYLRVSVRDNGIGMGTEELEKIFSPFYRVKNEKTRFIIGTGLGLAIVKSIVEAHNGFVRVDSEPDRGSGFHVFLPYNGL